MEFPLSGVIGVLNSSNPGDGLSRSARSLYDRSPLVAAPYVAVLGLAAVVGTLGNLVVIATVVVKQVRCERQRSRTTRNDTGRVFIANLALSDLIVTSLINPLAIAGMSCLWDVCG